MTRDARRRRNFFMEAADEDEEEEDLRDHFINPDLENRVQIFSSETQVCTLEVSGNSLGCRASQQPQPNDS